MCGRYTYRLSWRDIHRLYSLTTDASPSNLQPRYNVAPTQVVPIVRADHELAWSRWGMIPPWVRDIADIRITTINARAEGLEQSRLYRGPWHQARCLVPASGWYEWHTVGRSKQPHLIQRPGAETISFAGLWSLWRSPEGHEIVSHTIVVTDAAPSLRHIHDRMPVIVRPEDHETWLTAPTPPVHLLRSDPGPWEDLLVDPRVGRVSEDDEGLIQPLRRLL